MNHHTRAGAAVTIAVLALCGCSVLGEQSVPAEDLEEGVADLLEEQIGQPVTSVDCEGDLAAEVGTEVGCTLEADDGSTIGLTITAESVDGGEVNYQVQVDDQATPAPTGTPSAEPEPSAPAT